MITNYKIRKKRFDWEINLAFDAVVCDILVVKNRMENNRFADGGSVCIEFVDQIRIKASSRPLLLCCAFIICTDEKPSEQIMSHCLTAFCVADEFSRWLTAPNWLCVRRLHDTINSTIVERELNSSYYYSVRIVTKRRPIAYSKLYSQPCPHFCGSTH